MTKQAKAIVAALTSAAGVAVAFGLADEGFVQAVSAISTPLVTYALTWLVPNEEEF